MQWIMPAPEWITAATSDYLIVQFEEFTLDNQFGNPRSKSALKKTSTGNKW